MILAVDPVPTPTPFGRCGPHLRALAAAGTLWDHFVGPNPGECIDGT